MHEHAAGVLVFLTDVTGTFTFPDGTTDEITGNAGQTVWAPAVKHLPENTSDKALEVILVEMKVKEVNMSYDPIEIDFLRQIASQEGISLSDAARTFGQQLAKLAENLEEPLTEDPDRPRPGRLRRYFGLCEPGAHWHASGSHRQVVKEFNAHVRSQPTSPHSLRIISIEVL